ALDVVPLPAAEVARALAEQGLGEGDVPGLGLAEGTVDPIDIALPPQFFRLRRGPPLLAADQCGTDGEADDRRDEQGTNAYRRRLVPSPPARQPRRDRVAVGRDRLVGQPVLDLVGQGARRGVALFRL